MQFCVLIDADLRKAFAFQMSMVILEAQDRCREVSGDPRQAGQPIAAWAKSKPTLLEIPISAHGTAPDLTGANLLSVFRSGIPF